MEERTQHLFRVSHPAHGEAEVYASDRYFAVTAAAKEWGIRWSTIARECRVVQLPGEKRVAVQELRTGEAGKKPEEAAGRSPRRRAPGDDKGNRTTGAQQHRRTGGGRHGKADKKKQRDR